MFENHSNFTQHAIIEFLSRLNEIILTHDEASYLIEKIKESRDARKASKE